MSTSKVVAYPHAARILIAAGIAGTLLASATVLFEPLHVIAQSTLPFYYTFNADGVLYQSPTLAQSSSPYLWLASGGTMPITNGTGSTNAVQPQGIFRLFGKPTVQSPTVSIYVNRVADNLANTANRHPYIGESLFARYQNDNNYYYAGIRADGGVVIKKKVSGAFTTLAYKKLLPGTWSATSNPDLIPLNTWVGLKLVVADTAQGPQLSFYTDIGKTGTWKLALSVVDDPSKFGASITNAGLVGVESDYADAKFDNLLISATPTLSGSTLQQTPTPVPAPTPSSGSYDATVLSASPVMYLTMGAPSSGSESDKTGNGHNGTYEGGTPSAATLPNGDGAADFNGTSQYLTVPSSAYLSIPTTGKLTWEAWIRSDTFNFPTASGDGYVDWMGKCENYSPTCEWEARIYGDSTPEGRPDRLSAYVFNPSAGLGSAADWQPATNLQSGKWLHVVGEYDTTTTPSGCSSSYPGSISIWVNGVKQDLASHVPTGCMSQYSISPKAGSSPLTIGTMAFDTFFKGAVGKVAVYDRLLSQSEISAHYKAMTGQSPSGSCGQTCTITQ